MRDGVYNDNSNVGLERLLSSLVMLSTNDCAIYFFTYLMQELNYFGSVFSDDVHTLYKNATLTDLSKKLESIFDTANPMIISKIKSENIKILNELDMEARKRNG